MSDLIGTLREAIRRDHRIAEADVARRLTAALPAAANSAGVAARALELAARVRAAEPEPLSAESFLRRHGLSTREGVALMCVAEALLRIPDRATAEALLRDKLTAGDWGQESPSAGSWVAHAADWALMLTGTLAQWRDAQGEDLATDLKRFVARAGEPVAYAAVRQAMHILAEQFVLAETIEEAVRRAERRPQYRYSFDMLGEAARGASDARRYFEEYARAIEGARPGDGVSVKLSALHPRFEEAKRARIFDELLPRLRALARRASRGKVALTIDAEESERLELTLDLFAALAREPDEVGIAVQAYQKRALAVCDWLVAVARKRRRRIDVRLVKGAYWDGEIKRAQLQGMPDYPVFTRKALTDVAYMACAQRLLDAPDAIFPAFATHNCHTVVAILEIAGTRPFEFQRLLGMGDVLYRSLLSEGRVACRLYAPVGRFADLLPYLVRRLLENGANTSFVHQITDPRVPLESLVTDPQSLLPAPYEPDARIPRPRDLYPERRNSLGLDLSRRDVLDALEFRIVADRASALAEVPPTSAKALDAAIGRAAQAYASWSEVPAADRAAVLERAADAFESRIETFVSAIVREGRRTLADAVAEVRETIDFCRYYALEARRLFSGRRTLPGPAGERNELFYRGRGVFACISPWNFPLAIFTGQVTAALAAGNAVVAKPAEQTPRVALAATAILHEAGVPPDALACVPGDGPTIGAPLVSDPRIAGVAFTGSVETAKAIHLALAARAGPIVALIAETGGVNAMLVDSSALPEQVIDDVIVSAFQSAGQRCSALRTLFVEQGCAPRVLSLLAEALGELKVGDPGAADTDVGPIIDADAHGVLARHIEHLRQSARLIGETPLPAGLRDETFIAPVAFELSLTDLPRHEVFGPILHVCVFRAAELEPVLAWLRATQYGLTLGIHSRIERFVDRVVAGARVGNFYVNRSMIGAVVGVQPFGGEGLSGTGPKTGGPDTLRAFATARTLSVNTAAIGGVTELLTRPDLGTR